MGAKEDGDGWDQNGLHGLCVCFFGVSWGIGIGHQHKT